MKLAGAPGGRLTAALAIAAIATVLLIAGARPDQPGFAETPMSATRGQAGDLWADKIIGQPDFSETAPYETNDHRLWLPHGVIVDTRNPADQKFYVYDGGNSRILRIDLEDCVAAAASVPCTAEAVIGQPSMATSACNGDSGLQGFPKRAPASNATLCGIQEAQISLSEGGSGTSMAFDDQGNLYVTDFWNQRVLRYDDPLTTDAVADSVWGQSDFAGNQCNKGQGLAALSADTLCFTWGDENNWTAGVDIDADGNLWVVDSGNYRVLRFPAGQNVADLVLGQDDFMTSAKIARSQCDDHYANKNRFRAPSAVRVVRETDIPGVPQGRVYVNDHGCRRVLYFDPPFSQAAGYSGTVFGAAAIDAAMTQCACINPDIRPADPQGIDFDPSEPGRLWVQNMIGTLDLWDQQAEAPVLNQSGDRVYIGLVGNVDLLGDHSGSIGFDASGNVLVAIGRGSYDDDVIKFNKVVDGTTGDISYPDPPTRLFRMNEREFTARDLGGGLVGVEVSEGGGGDQLIVAEGWLGAGGRILFWNQGEAPTLYDALSNGQPADGSLAAGGFGAQVPWCCGAIEVNGAHLWTTGNLALIYAFDLPLQGGDAYVQLIGHPTLSPSGSTIPLAGGGSLNLRDSGISGSANLRGLAASPDGQFLWVSQENAHRIFRIQNPLTNPAIDVVLGQASSAPGPCNRGGAPAPDTLCNPGMLTLDNDDNLYVSDHWLEISGNKRILRFDASLFASIPPNTTLYAPDASAVFSFRATWEPSFDSMGHMVVGFNPYAGGPSNAPASCPQATDNWNYGGSSPSCSYLPGVYLNPLSGTSGPDAFFRDFYSNAYATAFDENDNLYIGDHNRTRVLVYKQPLSGVSVVGGVTELADPDQSDALQRSTGPTGRISSYSTAFAGIAGIGVFVIASAWVARQRWRHRR